ncbi:MAG TPA: caspase family protein [Vicinamibacteria bacterium]|nr:caspase family protein [Vicinamibacteria bacterium]
MRFSKPGFWCGFVAAQLAGLTSALGGQIAAEGTKRALIVAVGEYSSPDWDTLSSANDVPLVRAGLELHGFPPDSIHVISDAEATKEGIKRAVETYLASAKEGDVVFLHYSGHGQRIPDDNGDELDGYDEAWVPHDAPKSGEGYQGEKHLRDDELNAIVRRLRHAVGPSGNVILSIDSCFSGGTSRGSARIRGGPPMGSPTSRSRSATLGEDAGGGFFEEATRTRGVGDDSSPLGPYVVFSAARHDQLDYETVDDEGRVVGPLSLALSKTLAGSDSIGTYRDLFERVEWEMQSRVPNRPQVEGNVDAELFSGRAVTQRPFLDVTEVRSGGKQVVLNAGSLQGLLDGSRVELHRAGTRTPTPDTLLSAAVVTEATYVEAVADVETPRGRSELELGRAFVTGYAFGDLRVKVGLELDDSGLRDHVEEVLRDVSAVELVDTGSELSIQAADGNLAVAVTATGDVIFGPGSTDQAQLVQTMSSRLVDFARSRYLRGLRLEDREFVVALEVVPLDVTRCRDQADPSTCPELDVSAKRAAGTELVWKIGDTFKLRAKNESDRAAYITILDLPSDGTVNALWPADEFAERKQLKAGESWSPDVVYQFAEPPGNDVILLIATEDWIDFRPFLTGAGSQRSATGSLGPFSPLFDDTAVRTRSAVAYEPGSVTTDAVTITVEP